MNLKNWRFGHVLMGDLGVCARETDCFLGDLPLAKDFEAAFLA